LPASGEQALGPGLGDISVAAGTEAEAFVVRVFTDDDLLASRSYSEPWLQTSQLDELTSSR
jgi:hypothetical protein